MATIVKAQRVYTGLHESCTRVSGAVPGASVVSDLNINHKLLLDLPFMASKANG